MTSVQNIASPEEVGQISLNKCSEVYHSKVLFGLSVQRQSRRMSQCINSSAPTPSPESSQNTGLHCKNSPRSAQNANALSDAQPP